jgi:hypothetical protein
MIDIEESLGIFNEIYRRIDCKMLSNDPYHEAAEYINGKTSHETIFTNRLPLCIQYYNR